MPAFPLQVAVRATPGLRGRSGSGAPAPPFAVADSILDGASGRREAPAGATLLSVSAAARRGGVREGMTVTQGRALCRELIVRPIDPAAHEVARIAIAEVMSGFGPVVEVAEEWSAAFADVSGVTEEEEAALVRALPAALKAAGFVARAAIASNRFTARSVAAFSPRVVAPGSEAEALAPLPIGALPFGPVGRGTRRAAASDPAETFRRLGLATLGEIARLPADTLARRFGGGAAAFATLARGIDPTPLTPFRIPESLFEKLDLPAPTAELEPLLFSVKTLLDRVCARLAGRGRAAAKLSLHLVLEEWDRAAPATTIDLRLPRATMVVKTILEVAKERLARLALPGPAVELAIEVIESLPTRRTQLDLFSKAGPAPERLALTLGRLATAFGAGAVFSAALADEHRPERAYAAAVPVAPVGGGGAGVGRASGGVRPTRLLPVPEGCSVVPAVHGRSAELVVRGRRLAVTGMQGPERLSGEWWEEPFDRDYWLVRTEEGSQWWVFQDRGAAARGEWRLHGLFD